MNKKEIVYVSVAITMSVGDMTRSETLMRALEWSETVEEFAERARARLIAMAEEM